MVLFHAMAKSVADFWRVTSAGVLGYDLSRTQSILRVATTACPTGGSEVRERMVALEAWSDERWAALVIQRLVRWRRRAARKRAMSGATVARPRPDTVASSSSRSWS